MEQGRVASSLAAECAGSPPRSMSLFRDSDARLARCMSVTLQHHAYRVAKLVGQISLQPSGRWIDTPSESASPWLAPQLCRQSCFPKRADPGLMMGSVKASPDLNLDSFLDLNLSAPPMTDGPASPGLIGRRQIREARFDSADDDSGGISHSMDSLDVWRSQTLGGARRMKRGLRS